MIKLLIILFIVALSLVNTVQAFSDKNVTIELHKNEFIYCYSGECNYVEIDNKMRLINSFIEFLINGECK